MSTRTLEGSDATGQMAVCGPPVSRPSAIACNSPQDIELRDAGGSGSGNGPRIGRVFTLPGLEADANAGTGLQRTTLSETFDVDEVESEQAGAVGSSALSLATLPESLNLSLAVPGLPDLGTSSSDMPPRWAWLLWKAWCFVQATGNAALLAPTIVALAREPFPPCSQSLYDFSVAQAILRALQILFCVLLAYHLPTSIQRYTFHTHRAVSFSKLLWTLSIFTLFAQIVMVPTAFGLLLYTACPGPIRQTTGIIALFEGSVFLLPAIITYILPCLSGLLLDLPSRFTGASPAQLARLRTATLSPDAPEPCAICLDDMRPRETVEEMPCGHKFHKRCIRRYLEERGECPYCRRVL